MSSKFHAHLMLSWDGPVYFNVEGTTLEEAREIMRRTVLGWVEACLPDTEVSEELPNGVHLRAGLTLPETPTGLHLVVLEVCGDQTGVAWMWKFFAVPPGKYKFGGYDVETGQHPAKVSIMDNYEAEYELPAGSKRFVEGAWVDAEEMKWRTRD